MTATATPRYALVGCPGCAARWIIKNRPPPSRTRCPTCETTYQPARLNAESLLRVAAAYRERGDEQFNVNTADAVDAAVRAETGVDAAAVRRAAWYFGTGVKAVTRPSSALRDVGGAA